jgi:crossover junction endodeoxyribonuclease RuvC
MVILGIDPGSVRVGFGIIDRVGNKFVHLNSGLIKVPPQESERLVALERNLNKLLIKFQPKIIGIEKIFFAKNKKTAIRVAETRGVILNTIAKRRLSIIEITPAEVKIAVSGSGKASKPAIAKAVGFFLNLPNQALIDDVTDALAIAIAASDKRF